MTKLNLIKDLMNSLCVSALENSVVMNEAVINGKLLYELNDWKFRKSFGVILLSAFFRPKCLKNYLNFWRTSVRCFENPEIR